MEIDDNRDDAFNDDMNQVDHFSDDIDFSAIDNGENDLQTLEEKVESNVNVPEPIMIKAEPSEVKPKTEVKSSVFENIRPNWENGFSMEDDDDADLLSAVADEVLPIDDKQVS